jgi:hypothetical protein
MKSCHKKLGMDIDGAMDGVLETDNHVTREALEAAQT